MADTRVIGVADCYYVERHEGAEAKLPKSEPREIAAYVACERNRVVDAVRQTNQQDCSTERCAKQQARTRATVPQSPSRDRCEASSFRRADTQSQQEASSSSSEEMVKA